MERRTIEHLPHFAVIIRAMWERGASQQQALAELRRRGLWLTHEQSIAAGLE